MVEDYEKLYVDQDEIFQTLFFMDEKIAVSKAKHAAKKSLQILPAVEFCVLKDFCRMEKLAGTECNAARDKLKTDRCRTGCADHHR